MFREFAQRRLAGAQSCLIFDQGNPYGSAHDYRSPDSNTEHFCVAERTPTTPKPFKIKPSRVQISIPTLGLRSYLLPAIAHIIKAIQNDFHRTDASELPSIVVLSNGTVERSALDDFVDKFIRSNEYNVKTTLICTNVPGKSNAVNILYQHAVKNLSEILVLIDDDLRILPGTLVRLHEELADGLPRFIGIATVPDGSDIKEPVEDDILNMIIAKRQAMGWPAPIGRINALPVSIFPTISRFDIYDDVYLSAFFMINKVPQYVLSGAHAIYKPSSSLYEFIKRKRRIRESDERIIEILPIEYQKQYLDFAIKPKTSDLLSEADKSWLRVSEQLSVYAEDHGIFFGEQPSLDETDLSSKSGHPMQPSTYHDTILYNELKRLKRNISFV